MSKDLMNNDRMTVEEFDAMEIPEEHIFSGSYLQEKQRILASIPEKNHRRTGILIVATVVAAAVIVVVSGFLLGWFGKRKYTVTLANGDEVVYRSDGNSFGSFDLWFDCPTSPRELTESEVKSIFPEGIVPDRAFAEFNSDTGELLHLESTFGKEDNVPEMSINFDVDAGRVTDVFVDGNKTTSMLNGVPVRACYFITDANGSGKRDLLVANSFQVGKMYAYLCMGGDPEEIEAVCRRAAELTQKIIDNGDAGFKSVILKGEDPDSERKGDRGPSGNKVNVTVKDGVLEKNVTFVYSGNINDGKKMIAFIITLMSDGRYSYCESPISSYLGYGNYTISSDGLVTMTESEEMGGCQGVKNYFRLDGDRISFIEKDSSNFMYVKVRDGEEFIAEEIPEENDEKTETQYVDPELYEEMIPQIGLGVKLEDVTKDGCRAVFSYQPTDEKLKLTTGETWLLDAYFDYGYDYYCIREAEDDDAEHEIPEGDGTLVRNINWSGLCEPLQPGKYRLLLSISSDKDVGGDGGYHSFNIVCPFTIE